MKFKHPAIGPAVFFERVDYDPVSGIFRWKTRPHADFKTDGACKSWNSKHAGKKVRSRGFGYVVVTLCVDGIRYAVRGHQLAQAHATGRWSDGYIDHQNRARDDNRAKNLRSATKVQNNSNRTKREGTTSIYKGVSFYAGVGYWAVTITANLKRRYLGLYAKEEEAAFVYDQAAIELHGEYASLNGVKLTYTPTRIKAVRTGTSGIPGVYPHKQQPGKWMARKDKKHLGLFPSIELAAKALSQYELKE